VAWHLMQRSHWCMPLCLVAHPVVTGTCHSNIYIYIYRSIYVLQTVYMFEKYYRFVNMFNLYLLKATYCTVDRYKKKKNHLNAVDAKLIQPHQINECTS